MKTNNLDKHHNQDNLETISNIFHELDKDNKDKYLNILEKHSKETARNFQYIILTFDDLLRITPESIKKIEQISEKKTLLMALKGASDDVRNFFFSSISQKSVKILAEEIEEMDMVPLKSIIDAQSEIINIVQIMAEKGEIIIKANK